ncbi:MAG: beta-lactamase family protein [Gemmatimonadetes bacterium]|nr:beta-lactamase family protein [Gemmatimonadota bacterium]
MRRALRPLFASLACLPLAVPAARAQVTDRTALRARIDAIVQAPIDAGTLAGASIAVVRGSDTIAVKAYGKANLELGVPTPPNAIYEIGSVTKQFTGAAIMQLVEQGRLSLDDDISTWVPQFNTNGRRIPLRRLLDHTSGIRSYTEIPEARFILPLTLPRDTLLRVVERAGYDFEPGEEQIYNNSAFFLAGLVIEKVAGMPYAQYVEEKLMRPAGMRHAHYCSESAVRPGKTSGYDWDGKALIQKRPLSHQWPYAAGSLCSTALDLVRWNEALHRSRRLLSEASYRAMITADTLRDGARIGYAKGLGLTPVLGRPALHHGGGINGWTTHNLYFPAESLSVVVLFNSASPAAPAEAATKIAEAVLGSRPVAAKPMDGDAARFAGRYTGRGRGAPAELTIAVANGAVTATMRGASRPLTYLGGGTFTDGNMQLLFREEGGKVVAVRLDSGYGNNVLRRN